MSNTSTKIKLLAPNLTELIDLYPAQARQLQKNELVEKIPSNSELILRLKTNSEQFVWPLDILAPDFLDLIKVRISISDNDIVMKQKLKTLTPDNLSDVFAKIEEKDERVIACVFTPKIYSDIRRFGRDVLDLIMSPSLIKYGFMAILWSSVMVCRLDLFPEGHLNSHFYVLSKNRKVIVNLVD